MAFCLFIYDYPDDIDVDILCAIARFSWVDVLYPPIRVIGDQGSSNTRTGSNPPIKTN